jgi:hypothetical protein
MQPGESIREFYSRILSLPVHTLPPLLNEGTRADFARNLRSWTGAQRQERLAAICKSVARLAFVGSAKIVEERDLVFDLSRHAVSVRGGALKNFDWRWIAPDGRAEWFFIPLDVLP